jgi:hypothetical protein
MHQGKDTVQDYLDKFDRLARVANFDDDCMRISLAESRINTPLLEKLYGMEEVPNTWEKWCEKAVLFDDQWHRVQEIKKGRNPMYSTQKKDAPRKPFGVTSGLGAPMDLDQQKAQKKCFKCGKPEHMANECCGETTCFNCGKTGHIAAKCKAPKKARKQRGGFTADKSAVESVARHKGKSARTSWASGATVKELEALLAAARLKERGSHLSDIESGDLDFQ